jgi:anti-sigma factor RsiW
MVENETFHLDENALNEYLDGALDVRRCAALEAHLECCPECAARLAEIRGVFLALEALPDAPLKRDLAAPVVAAIRARTAWRADGRATRALGWFFVLQALASLVLLVFTWPFAAQNLPKWLPSWLSQWVALQIAAMLEVWSARWITFWELAGELVLQGIRSAGQLARQPVGLQIPLVELALLLIIASLAWLGANGLLLGPRRSGNHISNLQRRHP